MEVVLQLVLLEEFGPDKTGLACEEHEYSTGTRDDCLPWQGKLGDDETVEIYKIKYMNDL